jgi:hypothetical protein
MRVLLGEFLVVTLGVLVALALDQVLSGWQEQRRVSDTLLALDEELADFALVFSVRVGMSPCIYGKLDALDAVLSRSAELDSIENVGRPPFLFSSRGGWNSSGAELLVRHLGPKTSQTYGEIYQATEEFTLLAHREQEHWARLQTLQGHRGAVDEAARWRLRDAVAGARNANLLLSAIAEQMLARIDELGVDVAAGIPPDLDQRPICQPLDQIRDDQR